MKSATAIRNPYCKPACRYPNAAERGYFWNKLLNTLLAAALTLAIVTILLFLLALM